MKRANATLLPLDYLLHNLILLYCVSVVFMTDSSRRTTSRRLFDSRSSR